MIEVEQKFVVDDATLSPVLQAASFIGERRFTDTYFDDPCYSLTTKDIWLRARDGKWELKLPLRNAAQQSDDQYDELTDEDMIREKISLPKNNSLSEDLAAACFAPFCTITTVRKKYSLPPFVIDVDTLDSGRKIGEVELMVNTEAEIPKAVSRIKRFFEQHKIPLAPVRGKAIEYIQMHNPAHYAALRQAGVLRNID